MAWGPWPYCFFPVGQTLFLFCFILFVFFFFQRFYLFTRQNYRMRERSFICSFTPQMAATPELCQAGARSQEIVPQFSHGYRGLNTWAILWCFSIHISRVLEQKWSSQELNWHSYETPGPQVAAQSTMPQCQPLLFLFLFHFKCIYFYCKGRLDKL